jgi:[acyl-carrier-protein] S-malonyltransferase
MGRFLGDHFDIATETLAEADDILGYPLSYLCVSGPAHELDDIANSQPAILTVSVAAWRVLRSLLPSSSIPAALAGHSLGEFSALVAAGTLQFPDALRLVRARSIIIRDTSGVEDCGMLAIMAKDLSDIATAIRQVRAETGGTVEIASDSCPGQIVLGGHKAALSRLGDIYTTKGALCQLLEISAPLHTSLMQAAGAAFQAMLDSVAIQVPTVPVIGSIAVAWLESPEQIRRELSVQLTHTVCWTDCVRKLLLDKKVGAVVEVGPGRVLTALMRRIAPAIRRQSFGNTLTDTNRVLGLLAETQVA